MKNTIAVIFSYLRPLQLDLLLKSLKLHCLDCDNLDIVILARMDNEREGIVYSQVEKENFPVKIVQETNLQEQTKAFLTDKKYVLFATDDSVFVNDFRISDIQNMLESDDNILGFSLRLGLNCEYCYPVDKEQQIPDHIVDINNMITWSWGNAELDFNYPLEISSSLYETDKVMYFLKNFKFGNPNHFEYLMDQLKSVYASDYPLMASYLKSVAFASPINKINPENQNRSGTSPEFSVENLLTKYESGGRIDPSGFTGILSRGCHMEVALW